MNYDTAWVYTCGVCCLYPALAFAAGAWYARNGHRINLDALKFWRRHDR